MNTLAASMNSKPVKWVRVLSVMVIAGLAVICSVFSVQCSVAQNYIPASISFTNGFVRVTVNVSAYSFAVIQQAKFPTAHDNDWHAIVDIPANVNTQRVTRVFLPGGTAYYRAWECRMGPRENIKARESIHYPPLPGKTNL